MIALKISLMAMLILALVACSSETPEPISGTPEKPKASLQTPTSISKAMTTAIETVTVQSADIPTPVPTENRMVSDNEEAAGDTYVNDRSGNLDGLISIDLIDKTLRCAMGKPSMSLKSSCTLDPAVDRGLFETGIKPRFPDDIQCRGIDDYWAMDYSKKRQPKKSKKGKEQPIQLHGGIDMPAPFGTPIYASADGTVVGKFRGDNNLRGIEIVLRHSPDDTGLPVWTFTQYTHFSDMPVHEIGQLVSKGEFLGPTGNTGISHKTGKQSETRRPAVHFGVIYNETGNYGVLKDIAIIPEEGYWMDPNAFFLIDHPFDTASLAALPERNKEVSIPVMLEDGTTIPSETRTMWPYKCSH